LSFGLFLAFGPWSSWSVVGSIPAYVASRSRCCCGFSPGLIGDDAFAHHASAPAIRPWIHDFNLSHRQHIIFFFFCCERRCSLNGVHHEWRRDLPGRASRGSFKFRNDPAIKSPDCAASMMPSRRRSFERTTGSVEHHLADWRCSKGSMVSSSLSMRGSGLIVAWLSPPVKQSDCKAPS